MKKKKEHEHNENFVGFTLEELDKQFSSLSEEIKDGGMKLDSVMEVNQRSEIKPPFFRDYDPSIADFLERANTEQECLEIIEYCLNQNEISEEEANLLRDKLKRGGPHAFGTRKPGYYDSKL